MHIYIQCDEVFITLWYPWIQHTVPQDAPKIWILAQNSLLDYFYVLHIAETIALGWNLFLIISGALKHMYKMSMSSVDPCMNTDLGRPGDTFVVLGDRAI